MTDPKTAAADHLEQIRSTALELSHSIHAHPELGFAEHRASGLVAETLREAGFQVQTGVAGLPTALSGQYGDGSLVIGLFAEYDALPDIGHACGHNIIAAASVTAARLLAPLAEELDITVKLFGTPAEENGGGKVLMLEQGMFDDLHVAMMVHPAPVDLVHFPTVAVDHLEIDYTGRTAHGATAYLGRNAADAFTVAQVGIGLLRQQLPGDVLVHGIVTKGGEAPNVVPGHTTGQFYVRAATSEGLADARARVERCFTAGAIATDCEVSIRKSAPTYDCLVDYDDLLALYQTNAEALGRTIFDIPRVKGVGGSTDMGNVSTVIPTVHPGIGVESEGAMPHQPEFAAYCAQPTGDRAVLDGALGLAWTAIDLATLPEQRERLLARAATRG